MMYEDAHLDDIQYEIEGDTYGGEASDLDDIELDDEIDDDEGDDVDTCQLDATALVPESSYWVTW